MTIQESASNIEEIQRLLALLVDEGVVYLNTNHPLSSQFIEIVRLSDEVYIYSSESFYVVSREYLSLE